MHLDKKARDEVTKIVNEQIRKALKDVQAVKADVKKVRKDLDQHFERHLRALERRKRAKA